MTSETCRESSPQPCSSNQPCSAVPVHTLQAACAGPGGPWGPGGADLAAASRPSFVNKHLAAMVMLIEFRLSTSTAVLGESCCFMLNVNSWLLTAAEVYQPGSPKVLLLVWHSHVGCPCFGLHGECQLLPKTTAHSLHQTDTSTDLCWQSRL